MAGHNGGFNPYRDANGRFSSGGSSGGKGGSAKSRPLSAGPPRTRIDDERGGINKARSVEPSVAISSGFLPKNRGYRSAATPKKK